jgi:hypothetical protein
MTLPAAVLAHSAARVHRPGEARVRVVRYAVQGDALLCFGDGSLAGLRDGEHVFVDITNANGSLEDEFAATLREARADQVDPRAFNQLVENLPLGWTRAEMESALTRLHARRLVLLQP